MQDSQSRRILDMSGPWESVIRPRRKFVISMVFQIPKAVISSCPVCSTETSSRLVKEGSDIQWCEGALLVLLSPETSSTVLI